MKITRKLGWPFLPSASASVFYRCFFLQSAFPWGSLHKTLTNTVCCVQLSQFEFPHGYALLPHPGFRHQTHIWKMSNFRISFSQKIASHRGRLIFIHLQCWEVRPFSTIQRQWCIKILCPKDPEFYTPLVLNCQKGQHLSALEVYKNQSPTPQAVKATAVISAAPLCNPLAA